MNDFINNIKELYKKNPMILLIAFGLLFIIVVIIISLFSGDNINNDVLIEQPLQYYENQEIIVPEEIIKDEKPQNSAYVYDIDISNKVSIVEQFITSLGISNFKKNNQANVVYTWTGDFGLIEYIPSTQTLSFGLGDGIDLSIPDFSYISQDNIDEYFQVVTDTYLGLGLTYDNYIVQRDGRNYIVYANQIIDELPLHTQGYYTYSDKLVFNENGKLMSGKLLLVDILDNDSEYLIELVHPTNLNAIISDPRYPKEVNQGPIEGFVPDYNSDNDIYSDNYDYPEVTSTSATTVELVYFYSSNSISKLLPMYLIKGSGEVTHNGREYSVPMTIYVNAINPDNVLIPTDIEPQ